MAEDTIFALSSGPPPTGVAVFRISGPTTQKFCHASLGFLPKPRRAVLAEVRDPSDASIIDKGLVLFFPGPGSFTGEDILELQIHGGAATVDRMLEVLGQQPDMRLADPGEFSRRAFENNRMDLTEVEGLSDLIAAQTENQRKLALSQAGGALRTLCDNWRSRMIKARALVEAELDFADEEDVPGSVSDQVWPKVSALASEIQLELDRGSEGEIMRSGLRVALLGAPNAGKSSLLNALARRDVAIVTEKAGTTRDVLEVPLDISGQLVIVSDTAGLRDTEDVIESEGIRRARMAAERADVILWLSASDNLTDVPQDLKSFHCVRVLTKADLLDSQLSDAFDCSIDTISDDGVNPLVSLLKTKISSRFKDEEPPAVSRRRHQLALQDVVRHLESALKANLPFELRSESLRQAADALGRITGRIDVEDLLDVIFAEFCVGK